MNINEAIINHIDSGDLILDILEAQEECGDNKYDFGVRVANVLNDFKDKISDEINAREDKLASVYMQDSLDKLAALGDFKLKERKEE